MQHKKNSFARRLWLKSRPFVPLHRRNPVFKAIARLSYWWLKAYENCNGDFSNNGEEMVLRTIAQMRVTTLFDVGANAGDWSLLAHRFMPAAKIYAFELSPPTFERLRENIRDRPEIRGFNFGLSDRPGEVAFYHYPDKPGETSLLAHSFQVGGLQLKGSLCAGDDFCAEQNIQHIDLLKIDVEGAESFVLRGFAQMLSAGRISAIQFEYEKLNVVTKFLLKDFYDLLGAYGYAIGKIFPSYVDFRDYDFEHELLWGSNYLAVRKDRPELLSRFLWQP